MELVCMAPKSGTRHMWPGRPPQPTTDGGCMCGTKIWHHRHTWPNRSPHNPQYRGSSNTWHQNPAPQTNTAKIGPPLQPTIEGVTHVAPKSGTTNIYGQIGLPHNPHSPQRKSYTCGTKIQHHKIGRASCRERV